MFFKGRRNITADRSVLFKTLTRQRTKKSTFGSEQAQNAKGEWTKEEAAGNT